MTMQVPDRIVVAFFTAVVGGLAGAVIALFVKCNCGGH